MKMKKRDTGSLPLFQPSAVAAGDMPDFTFSLDDAPDTRFEDWLHNSGHRFVAGTDEAGRGPLAGPVVAAAVILPRGVILEGLNDSKKLSEAKRNALFDLVMESASCVSVCSISAESIDRTDIRKASLETMRRCVATLTMRPDAVLVDGRDVPPGLPADMRCKALVKGDGRSMSIAAAAIIAKVTRDRMMAQLGVENPDYGLENHKGYGSEHHRAQIMHRGGVPRVHRFSFRPLKQDA